MLEEDSFLQMVEMKIPSLGAHPICAHRLLVGKLTGSITLERMGVAIDLDLLCPSAFTNGKMQISVDNCDRLLKSIFNWSEKSFSIKRQTESLDCLMKDLITRVMERGMNKQSNTLRFLSKQLQLTTGGLNEYPSIVKIAMVLRFHSKSSYNALRDSEILSLPSNTTLDKFIVSKRAPGIPPTREQELGTLASSLHVDEKGKLVRIVFDEMPLQALTIPEIFLGLQ